jgi:hypothetical protein
MESAPDDVEAFLDALVESADPAAAMYWKTLGKAVRNAGRNSSRS